MSSKGLHRDILVWMQSLDLSYSVKNVKRDFSNGFLVAEIFSRYYKQDLSMHSFDNGTGIKKRKDNWKLLQTFFKKKSIQIDPALIEPCIHCQDGAAVPLVSRIYTVLTKKNLPSPISGNNDGAAPPFSRPIANTLVGSRMRDSDMLNRDRKTQERAAQQVVDQHNESLRQDRTLEPQRFMPNNTQKAMHRVATRKVTNLTDSSPQVQFKKVQVRQIDDNVTSIRAIHSSGRQGMGHSLTNGSQLGSASLPGGNATGGAGRGVVKPSIDLLNTCVLSKLEGNDIMKRFDPRKDAFVCFVEDLATFPNDIATTIFEDAQKKVGHLIADNCLASPKEFWSFFNMCWVAVTKLRSDTTAFDAVVGLLESVGRLMVEKDQYVPFALLCDFGLPKIISLLKRDANNPKIIRILYAFSVEDVEEHVNVIRKLRDTLEDFDTFVVCLSTLVRLETQFSNKLLDLYLYYILAGLHNRSPTIRACCLSMLVPIAKAQGQGHKQVITLYDRIEGLSKDDPSWQVKSAVVEVAAALLSVLPSNDQLCPRLYQLLGDLTAPGCSSLVLQTAIVAMTQCLTAHPTVKEIFMSLVRDQVRTEGDLVQRACGSVKDGLSVVTTQQNISSIMDRKAVAVAIAEEVKQTKPDNLSPSHVRLLAKAVEGLEAFPANELMEWIEVYESLRDHLVVELYEPSTCGDAVAVLGAFLKDRQTMMMAMELLATEGEEDPPLYGILKLIYSEGHEVCKKTVANFLADLSRIPNTEFPDLVYKLLKNFSKLDADKFANSELEFVLADIQNRE